MRPFTKKERAEAVGHCVGEGIPAESACDFCRVLSDLDAAERRIAELEKRIEAHCPDPYHCDKCEWKEPTP